MNVPQLSCALVLSAAILSAAHPQSPSSGRPSSPGAGAPRTDHAVGYYDPSLRRVVLIGNAGDPMDGERERVWSWTGTRWEIVTEIGPPGRTNAGAAYDVRRGVAVVTGGARKSTVGHLGVGRPGLEGNP